MITKELKERFEKVIEIKHIDWNTIEDVCKSDTNILRPILGIAYEEYFKKIIRKIYPDCNIINGVGDSDIDLYINNHALQLKTINKENTIEGTPSEYRCTKPMEKKHDLTIYTVRQKKRSTF